MAEGEGASVGDYGAPCSTATLILAQLNNMAGGGAAGEANEGKLDFDRHRNRCAHLTSCELLDKLDKGASLRRVIKSEF